MNGESVAPTTETYFETIRGLGLAALVYDHDRQLVFVSPACGELLSYCREELDGLSSEAVVHPDDAEHLRLHATRSQPSSGQRVSTVLRFVRKDGSPIWVTAQISSFTCGTEKYQVLVSQDASESYWHDPDLLLRRRAPEH